jgi:hypothetical protein
MREVSLGLQAEALIDLILRIGLERSGTLRWSQDEISMKLLATAATDEVLVTEAKLGDHPSFVKLWERHSNTAFKMVYRITRNRDDAEDVVQDAWTKAYVHLKTFDGRAKFATWLTRNAQSCSVCGGCVRDRTIPRSGYQLRVCYKQVFLSIPRPARPHRRTPILRTHAAHTSELSACESALATRTIRELSQ